MLRVLLAALAEGNGLSSAQIRARLGIGRDLYDQLLAQLVRLGFVAIEAVAAAPGALSAAVGSNGGSPGCRTPSCAGCPVPCGNNPANGATGVRITERGLAFVRRNAS